MSDMVNLGIKVAKSNCDGMHCADCPFCFFDTCAVAEIRLRLNEIKEAKEN